MLFWKGLFDGHLESLFDGLYYVFGGDLMGRLLGRLLDGLLV